MTKQETSKTVVFDRVAGIASLLGAPARLKILLLVSQAPRSVESISEQTGESVANVSQHLKKLREGGLLSVEKDGVSRIYRLSDERVAWVLEDLFDLAELHSPLTPEGESSPLSLTELKRELRAERAVLIDVRDADEVSVTPVPGAVAMELGALRSELKNLSQRKTYFVICRGRACERASEGVELLRARGFKAYRIKESPASLRLNRKSFLKNEKESSHE